MEAAKSHSHFRDSRFEFRDFSPLSPLFPQVRGSRGTTVKAQGGRP